MKGRVAEKKRKNARGKKEGGMERKGRQMEGGKEAKTEGITKGMMAEKKEGRKKTRGKKEGLSKERIDKR